MQGRHTKTTQPTSDLLTCNLFLFLEKVFVETAAKQLPQKVHGLLIIGCSIEGGFHFFETTDIEPWGRFTPQCMLHLR